MSPFKQNLNNSLFVILSAKCSSGSKNVSGFAKNYSGTRSNFDSLSGKIFILLSCSGSIWKLFPESLVRSIWDMA